MTLEEALASIENDGIRLGAGDYVSVEALKVAADVLRKAINGNPVIPGCDDQYNIAEMSYNNGYAKGCEDRKPKWIPVSERLPERGQEVIVASYRMIKPVVFATIFWNKEHDNWYGITHWMPLPKPPKEEK